MIDWLIDALSDLRRSPVWTTLSTRFNVAQLVCEQYPHTLNIHDTQILANRAKQAIMQYH